MGASRRRPGGRGRPGGRPAPPRAHIRALTRPQLIELALRHQLEGKRLQLFLHAAELAIARGGHLEVTQYELGRAIGAHRVTVNKALNGIPVELLEHAPGENGRGGTGRTVIRLGRALKSRAASQGFSCSVDATPRARGLSTPEGGTKSSHLNHPLELQPTSAPDVSRSSEALRATGLDPGDSVFFVRHARARVLTLLVEACRGQAHFDLRDRKTLSRTVRHAPRDCLPFLEAIAGYVAKQHGESFDAVGSWIRQQLVDRLVDVGRQHEAFDMFSRTLPEFRPKAARERQRVDVDAGVLPKAAAAAPRFTSTSSAGPGLERIQVVPIGAGSGSIEFAPIGDRAAELEPRSRSANLLAALEELAPEAAAEFAAWRRRTRGGVLEVDTSTLRRDSS